MAHNISIGNKGVTLAQKSDDFQKLEELGLENPDQHGDHNYNWSDDFLQRIIGSLLADDYFLEKASQLVKPEYFRSDAHRMLCRIIFDFYGHHGTRPDKTILRNELDARIADIPNRAYYLAELDAVCDAYEPGIEKRDYFLDRITEFAKTQALRLAYNTTLDLFGSGKKDKWNRIWEALDAAREVGQDQEVEKPYWTLADLGDSEVVRHLIEDHIIESGLAYLNAESGTGKTFLAIDMGLSIATGMPYMGEHAVIQGPVIYVGEEGATDNKLRVKGWVGYHMDWLKRKGLSKSDIPFYYVPRDFDLRKPTELKALLRIIRGVLSEEQPKAIILDTVFNMLGGGNDSDPTDMGGFIGSCKSLIRETGAAVICVSHPGHENKYRMRGHSCQWPACDTILLAEGSVRTGITITHAKQKSFSPIEPYKVYTSKVGPVAKDRQGHDVCTLVCHGKQDAWKFRLERLDDTSRGILHRIIQVCGLEPFSYSDVMKPLTDKDDPHYAVPKRSFDRRWKELREKEFVNEAGDGKLRLCAGVVQQLAL